MGYNEKNGPGIATTTYTPIVKVLLKRMERAGRYGPLAQIFSIKNQKNSILACSAAPVRGSAGIIVRRPRSTKFPIL